MVELLLVIVPLAGAIYAAVKGISAVAKRQNEAGEEPPADPEMARKAKRRNGAPSRG